MLSIVLATHGDFGRACLDAVTLIAGPQQRVQAFGLHHGDSPDGLEQQLLGAIDELDDGDGVLVLVDVFGGTPANLVLKLMQCRPIRAVAGLSLPMALDALTTRAGRSLDEVARGCREMASMGLVDLNEIYERLTDSVGQQGSDK